MNILQLMPQSPLPATDGGKVGLWNETKQFALAGHTVYALYYGTTDVPKADYPLIYFNRVPVRIRNTPWRILQSLFYGQSLFVHKHITQEMRKAIAEVVENNSIDVVHADHTCMAPMALWTSEKYNIPWGLRLHNVEWMIWQRYAERFSKWHPVRWYVQSQAKKLRWDEADLIRQAHVAFPITDIDAKRAQELAPSTHFRVALGGVDIPEYSGAMPAITTDVVMASSWTWVHNIEGLRWFLQSVWPIVRAQLPSATFGVLGKNVPTWVEEFSNQGVVAEGYAEDLYQRLHQSLVYVAPLFVGSGIRIKVLEALAAGLPVVATSISAEGIDVNETSGLFRCDTADDTARCLITLLTDHQLRERLFVSTRKAMEETFTWKASVANMISEYQALVHSSGRS